MNNFEFNKRISKVKEDALNNNIPIIRDNAFSLIFDKIDSGSVKNILEVGSAWGYSALMLQNNFNARVKTIEILEDNYNIAKSNIKEFGKETYIEVINDNALNVNIDQEEKFDLIFIDAAKSKYLEFLLHFSKNSHKNTIFIFDNVNLNMSVRFLSKRKRQLIDKVEKFLGYVKDNYEYEHFNEDDGILFLYGVKND